MRFRRVMAALMPVGAASALAILPIGVPVAAQAAAPATGHVTPEASSPLAYRYVGKDGSRAPSSGYLFTCQKPGASPNCYTPQELATAYDIPDQPERRRADHRHRRRLRRPDDYAGPCAPRTARSGCLRASLSILYPDGKPAFNPANANEVNWSGEIALDVESAHAIAPAAKIDLVIAKSDARPRHR